MVALTLSIKKKDWQKELRVPVKLGGADRHMLRELNAYYGFLSDTSVIRFGVRRILENHSDVSISAYQSTSDENISMAQISLPGHWKAIMIKLRDHFEFESLSELTRYIIRKEYDGITAARKRSGKFLKELEITDPIEAVAPAA